MRRGHLATQAKQKLFGDGACTRGRGWSPCAIQFAYCARWGTQPVRISERSACVAIGFCSPQTPSCHLVVTESLICFDFNFTWCFHVGCSALCSTMKYRWIVEFHDYHTRLSVGTPHFWIFGYGMPDSTMKSGIGFGIYCTVCWACLSCRLVLVMWSEAFTSVFYDAIGVMNRKSKLHWLHCRFCSLSIIYLPPISVKIWSD